MTPHSLCGTVIARVFRLDVTLRRPHHEALTCSPGASPVRDIAWPCYDPGMWSLRSRYDRGMIPLRSRYDPGMWPCYGLSKCPRHNPSKWPCYNPSKWPCYGLSKWPRYNPSKWPRYDPVSGPVTTPTCGPSVPRYGTGVWPLDLPAPPSWPRCPNTPP